MSGKKEVELRIPSSSEYVGIVRLTASGIANRLMFNVEEIEDIKIAVSEACTNAVQYAYPNGDGEIVVKFMPSASELEVVVEDKGVGFDPQNPVPHTGPINGEKVGLGLGITFMKSLMDEVTCESEKGKGTTIRLKKKVMATSAAR